jgi:hypothetical protein
MAVRAVMRLALSVDGAPAPQVSIHVHLSRSPFLTRFLAPSCLPLSPPPHAWLLPAGWTAQSEGGRATKAGPCTRAGTNAGVISRRRMRPAPNGSNLERPEVPRFTHTHELHGGASSAPPPTRSCMQSVRAWAKPSPVVMSHCGPCSTSYGTARSPASCILEVTTPAPA